MALNLSKNDNTSSEDSGNKKLKLNLEKKEVTPSDKTIQESQEDSKTTEKSNKGLLYIVIGLLVFGAGIFFYQYNSNSEGVTSSAVTENDTAFASGNNALPKDIESDSITGSQINSAEAAPLGNGEAPKTEGKVAVVNSINQLIKDKNIQVAYFDAGSDQILTSDTRPIDLLIEYLSQKATNKISVVGYASSEGDSGLNKSLSENRAIKFKELLVSKGANAMQINTRGEGSARPIANNTTIEGRKRNRRVEFILE
jgi:outer membrane protein OmpA-like peptidoglycan-associated protein